MENNNCDGAGPHTPGQVRSLPYGGEAGGNLILCLRCYQKEIASRKEDDPQAVEPEWQSLKIYGQDETEPEPTAEEADLLAALDQMEEAFKSAQAAADKLPPFPFPLPTCCADPVFKLVEEGYSRSTTVDTDEAEEAPLAYTDGYDDYSDNGAVQFVTCLNCRKAWKTPEGLDYV